MYKGEVHLQTDRKSPEFSQAIEKLINFKITPLTKFWSNSTTCRGPKFNLQK